METAATIYKGDLRTEITHLRSGRVITTDAPPDNKGKGESFSPTDLVASALGSCIFTIPVALSLNESVIQNVKLIFSEFST